MNTVPYSVVRAVLGDGGLARNLVQYGGLAPEQVEDTSYAERDLPRESIGLHTRPDHDVYLPRIMEMVGTLRAGGSLPRVVVAVLDRPWEVFECYDGYHRLHAYRLEGVEMVPVYEWLKGDRPGSEPT